MSKNIITVERAANRGMTVTISGGVQECMEAIGNVIAAAVANMADGGTPEEAIHQQMGICMAYGLQHGMRRAKSRQTTTERVEIGYTVDKERWNEAADSMEEAAGPMAAYLLQLNGDGMGQEDADDFMADVALVVTATRYVAEFAADKCRFIPMQGKPREKED